MAAKRIIPCLDVKDGRVVKGVHFVQLKDAGDPVKQAAFYDKEGADELIFLDITASCENRDIMLDMMRRTAAAVFMPVTVGGGIRTVEDAHKLISSGADKISLNTAAVSNPDLINECARRFGSQAVVIAVDAKREGSRWRVVTMGGRKPSAWFAADWIREAERRGAGEILLTSMDRDGTKNGYDIELTKMVSGICSLPVIASGGCGHPEHIFDVLTKGRADAALAASIFHFRKYSIQQTKQYLKERSVHVRCNPF